MDKKKMGLVLVVLLSTITSAMAQAKYYNNYSRGYSGYAAVFSVESKRTAPLKDMHYDSIRWTNFSKGVSVGKLSDEEVWLLWQAIDEYDYRVGEVYNVVVGNKPKIISITAEITGKDVCSYCATYVLAY